MLRAALRSLALCLGLAIAGSASAMSLTSSDFKTGSTVPDEQVFNSWGCTGKNVSPQLSWSGVPKGTKSFALTVYDPDAPTGSGFWHRVLFNIPPDVTSLAKGAGDPKNPAAPKGAIQGHTDYGAAGYGGPCPPKGDRPHRYIFTLHALDTDKLEADENATAAVVGFYLHVHTIGKALLMGRWGH